MQPMLPAIGSTTTQAMSSPCSLNACSTAGKSIEQGNTQAVNYFVAQKYIEALGQVASADNQKVVFMPLEASGVIGSIAGITELFNNSRGPTKSRGVNSENIVADVAALDQDKGKSEGEGEGDNKT